MSEKIINLTESQLRRIIEESILKILVEQHLLMEMAYPRKIYKEKVNNDIVQVLINWCLVHYCTITGRTTLKKHWKEELKGHFGIVAAFSLKDKDSSEKRRKIIEEIWNERDFSFNETLKLIIGNKFVKENIDINSEEFAETIEDCINNKDKIIDTIVSKNLNYILSYIETI